jgi:hypothetical protein
VFTIGQNPLGRQTPLGGKERTAVGAERSSGSIQQVAVVFCGPQLDPAGLDWPMDLGLGAGSPA